MNAENLYLRAKIECLERELSFYRRNKDKMIFPFDNYQVSDLTAPLPTTIQCYNIATLAIKEDDKEVALLARGYPPFEVGFYCSHTKSTDKRFVEIYDILEKQLTNMVVASELKRNKL